MWLLPLTSLLSRATVRVYYRFRVEGPAVPRRGPVLMLANHPNALLDPAIVMVAARRPVRFLAKSTLFDDARTRWFVQGAGAIPVYRRIDEPTATGRNVDMFDAVYRELAGEAAIGVFPEGISHSEPSLSKLKTGSARIALGFHARHGRTFPIVPVGLVLRNKREFRSRALALLGDPVPWDDLAALGEEDPEAARALTDRIDLALRRLTINLEHWADRPLVEMVEQIWTAEGQLERDPARRVERIEATTTALGELRRSGDDLWTDLSARVLSHRRRLRRLGLTPLDLSTRVDLATGLRWTIRKSYLAFPLMAPIAIVGYALFWLPYRATGLLVDRMLPEPEMVSTYKVVAGAALYTVWVVLLAALAGWAGGWFAGLATLFLVPVVGLVSLRIRERWAGAWDDVRRFFLLRSRRPLVRTLQQQQTEIAEALSGLAPQHSPANDPSPPDQ